MGVDQFYDATGFSRGPVLVMLPSFWKANGTGKMVIVAPGHLAPEVDFNMNQPAGRHLIELVKTGYGIAAFKFSQWAQAIVPTEADDLLTYLGAQTKVKCRTDKYAEVGWSMGCFNTLRISRDRSSKVVCWWGWNPLTDGQWTMSTTGYVPPYSTAGSDPSKPAGFKQEIADTFGVTAGSAPPAGIDALALAAQHRGRPHHLVNVLDDTTVPAASGAAFRDAVADPLCTLAQPATGGHIDPFTGTPVKDFLQFFQGYW